MFLFLQNISKGLIALDIKVYGAFTVPIAIGVLLSLRLRGGDVTNCVSG